MGKLNRTGGQEFPHESRTVNAVSERGTLAVQAPDQGHSIGNEKVEVGRGGGKGGLMPPHGDDVGVGKIDRVGTGLTTTSEEVRAEGFVVGAGKIGREDAAG